LETILKKAAPASEAGPITGTWRKVVACALIVLVGFNIRSVILGVPPVLPLIQHDLGLSYAAIGFLTALPVLVLAGGSWPSGLLAGRISARLCVSIGLVLLGAGTFLRALWPTALSLFLFTLLLSLGITLSQTAVPVLIRHWFPKQIGFVAALFTDGLIIGEAVAAGLTVPVMLRFMGSDAWASTFVFWGVPIVVLLLFWLWLAPPAHTRVPMRPFSPQRNTVTTAQTSAPPIQRTRVSALHLGILVGGGSLVYFGMNAWIASYNQAMHQSNLTPLSLLVLNAAQLPASLGVTLIAQQLAGRRWPFVAAGIVCAFAITGWIFTPAMLQALWAALLGGSSALVFTLGTALPPLLASPQEVGRLTGITFSLTYAVAFVGPFAGGALWDLFHLPAMAFVPVAAASVMLIILGALLPSRASFGIPGKTKHTGENKPGAFTATPPGI
jgi:CP family cyanate transporter-like MFS transporter